jgi:hypothetical protein
LAQAVLAAWKLGLLRSALNPPAPAPGPPAPPAAPPLADGSGTLTP